MRLHLGCGRYYLQGYVNIDYPPSQHTVQVDLKADRYCDLASLDYPPGTIEEVRLHHVFEHFPRPVALALVCRWREWLKQGGMLRVETPDLAASAWQLVSPLVGYREKQQVVRHLFGSHESHWAVHWDGWDASRFRRTLSALGFEDLAFRFSKWGALRNLEVTARRSARAFDVQTYKATATELLRESLVVDPSGRPLEPAASEDELLNVWTSAWETAFRRAQPDRE